MTGKQKTIARSIAFNIASFIEKKAAGLFFINGVTFYLKPADQNMKFGSAELEMTFQYDDTKDTIEQKFIDYFADGFADEVEYTGWDRDREAKNKALSHVFEKKSRYYREVFSKRSYMHICLSENDIEQIKARYFNAMAVSKELQKAGDPESRFEAGRAYALEGILRMLGFDYTDMASGRVLEAEQEGGRKMIDADKAKNTWIRICGIYDQTREKKPSETMRSILKEMDYQEVLETFAAVTKLKDHDGRISGFNKKAMDQVDTNPACIKIGPGNPLLDSGWIDFIHPTHIDQLIDALLREKGQK